MCTHQKPTVVFFFLFNEEKSTHVRFTLEWFTFHVDTCTYYTNKSLQNEVLLFLVAKIQDERLVIEFLMLG